MRTVKQMLSAKGVMLSEMESSMVKGNYVKVGAGTSYYGPSNPTSISTYVDGFPWGEDGLSGSLFGDSWAVYAVAGADSGPGKLLTRKADSNGG